MINKGGGFPFVGSSRLLLCLCKKKSTVLQTKYSAFCSGGDYRDRTGDLLHAMQALSQLS